MAKQSKLPAAELARRSQQSDRDKQRARKPAAGGNGKAGGSGPSGKSSRPASSKVVRLEPYTQMILDPCQAKLTPTPLPGREGSSIFRLPFRQVFTVPTTTSGVYGGSPPSGTGQNMSSLQVLLTPSAANGAGGPTAITVYATPNEGVGNNISSANSSAQFNYSWAFADPTGLSGLNSMTSLIRPVAGCVKLEFYSGTNSGSFMAYEGPAGQYIAHTDSDVTKVFQPTINNSQVAQLGWSTSITTQGVEACVNYASAAERFQEFRNQGGSSNVNADAGDLDFSGMPIGMVGVGGATPGAQYLVSGAIIYEWVPSLNLLVAGDISRPTVRKQSILDKVAGQIAAYGPMLVGAASKYALGGPSLATSDLLFRLSRNLNNTSSSGYQSRIAWQGS